MITHYHDEVKNKKIHNLEINFIINVNKSDVNVILSKEHCDYKWVKKDSKLLDDYIKDKFLYKRIVDQKSVIICHTFFHYLNFKIVQFLNYINTKVEQIII